MSQFASLRVADLLDAFASPQPTPGGGTAAALAGAMAASLLMMVSGLARSRTNGDEERARLAEAREALAIRRERLLRLADDDAASFDAVMAAYRRPKETDEEKAARREAIQQALRGATDVPIETCRVTADVMRLAATVAECGNPAAASDVAVAIGLLVAAVTGAAQNVQVNLAGLTDADYASAVTTELVRLTTEGADLSAAARRALGL